MERVDCYPMLWAIDQARGPGFTPFASAPDADRLEQRARTLAAEYWSEMAWLTGNLSTAQLDTVCRHLECERGHPFGDVHILVLPEGAQNVHAVAG